MNFAPLLAQLPQRHRLGTRIVAALAGALLFGLTMILGTLWLSWALEGAAAAINDTGSLRMRSVRLGLWLQQPAPDWQAIQRQTADFQRTLNELRRGDPQRPLRLPESHEVFRQFDKVSQLWSGQLSPALTGAIQHPDQHASYAARYLRDLPVFVEEANHLVTLIEAENARDTTLLRLSQLALAALAIAGTVTLIYLLYGWVIHPVEALRDGIGKMASHDFDARVPVESRDEFGELAEGFNEMAERLQSSYSTLEQRVVDKTAQLASQNRDLTTLYEITAYLSQPGDLETRCHGFLKRLMARFGADGGSVRIRDPKQDNLHMVIHEGLSKELVEAEHCLNAGDCLCGAAAQSGVSIIRDFRNMPRTMQNYRCEQDGFASIAIFHIMNASELLGSYTLHFRQPRAFEESEQRLLDTLGRQLGVAIENQRLLARTRELAVAEERNLVAQGLHDSIAQGLNFLNLQVQMLQDSLKRNAHAEMVEGVELLKAGVKESYEDVRELLLNFRMKLKDGDLLAAIRMACEKFTRQTNIPVRLNADDSGPPLPPEQQLQVLFIVQEALSNIRKHASASEVVLTYCNNRDFSIAIADNGRGFDPNAKRGDQHVGLSIMRERAERLSALLQLKSQPNLGTEIALFLPSRDRIAA